MKFITKILLIALFAAIAQIYSPWWIIAVMGFLVSLFIRSKGFSSFLAGFIAIFLLWTIKAYLVDAANEQILSTKIAALFTVTPMQLILITGAIGGFVTGFASLAGSNLRSTIKPERKRKNKYYT